LNTHHLYKILIAPRSLEPSAQNQELVLNWLLVGSLGLTLAAFISTLIDCIVLHAAYLLVRSAAVLAVLAFFSFLLFISRQRRQHTLPSVVVIAIFFLAAASVVFYWDISNPFGSLLFSVAIVMAGILLNARFSLYMALLTSLYLIIYMYGKVHGYWSPDLTWLQQPSRSADVANFTALYAILALVSWLFNGQMEMALRRAKRSEKALKRQRDSLEVEVQQRTRELQAVQLEQIQEVYRFAELGHLSTALFHDMANHLMSVSIDIEGLQKGKSSVMLARIQENVNYINKVVRHVRRQINGHTDTERFNVIDETRAVTEMLAYQSQQAQVALRVQTRPGSQRITYRGDVTRFRQIIINLLSNGIEAYDKPGQGDLTNRVVLVTVVKIPKALRVTITDHGKPIKPAIQTKIFEPFYSTKDKGMGIGLFIVKKITEHDFGGSITVTSSKRGGTIFTVNLPLGRHDHHVKSPAS
jgi:signal transduction histidine kinase